MTHFHYFIYPPYKSPSEFLYLEHNSLIYKFLTNMTNLIPVGPYLTVISIQTPLSNYECITLLFIFVTFFKILIFWNFLRFLNFLNNCTILYHFCYFLHFWYFLLPSFRFLLSKAKKGKNSILVLFDTLCNLCTKKYFFLSHS